MNQIDSHEENYEQKLMQNDIRTLEGELGAAKMMIADLQRQIDEIHAALRKAKE